MVMISRREKVITLNQCTVSQILYIDFGFFIKNVLGTENNTLKIEKMSIMYWVSIITGTLNWEFTVFNMKF
jgi:hypothetical protein